MSKFDYAGMFNEDTNVVCYNKKLYTEEEALQEGKEELQGFGDFDYHTVCTGFVRYGYYTNWDGDKLNGWSVDFSQTERKARNEIEVWVVEGFYE